MTTPVGFTFASQAEENNCEIAPDSSKNALPSFNNYFKVMGIFERKCRLCSKTILRNTNNGDWNLRRHFKAKHQAEWAEIEPYVQTRKFKKSRSCNAKQATAIDATISKVISANTIDYDYGNPYPHTFDQMVSDPMAFGMVDVGSARPSGSRRAKFGQMDSKNEAATKDEFTIFGEYVANEMRNMKTDHFRRELKRAFAKCLLEATEREEAALALAAN